MIPIGRPPVCGYNDVVSHKIQAHKGGESMGKTFLKSLIKDQILPSLIKIFEMLVKALLDNSTFETDGKHFKYAYNGVACR